MKEISADLELIGHVRHQRLGVYVCVSVSSMRVCICVCVCACVCLCVRVHVYAYLLYTRLISIQSLRFTRVNSNRIHERVIAHCSQLLL